MRNGRKVVLETLMELCEKDDKIILVIGDVGFSFIEILRDKYPKQFLNTGVMEQSMMGIAVGLANEGYKPFVYTMRNFIAFRPYEQVRNDIAFSGVNVKLIGVAGSEAYKFLGASHNVFRYKNGTDEDIAMLTELPNMKVYQAKTEEGLKKDLVFEYDRLGPAYFVI